DIPSLKERPEDVLLLMQKFMKEAFSLFGSTEILKLDDIKPDLTRNSHSLRKQIMIHFLLKNISERELIEIVENYLFERLGSNSDYKNFLHLYEVPLINAGLRKFKSQLQLSDKLGLNRNTLRKKIADNNKYL
ncbi:MAG: Fis family transcriptional regulator, partial [Sulfurimonas sp.]|nr:Fis family transcriptional regulator [Sulfurimonas sp.]